MPIIEVNHVTKEYQLGQIESLKTTALNQWRRLTGKPFEEHAPFKALDDVSFSIEQGEVSGVIGHKIAADGRGQGTIKHLADWLVVQEPGIRGYPQTFGGCANFPRPTPYPLLFRIP